MLVLYCCKFLNLVCLSVFLCLDFPLLHKKPFVFSLDDAQDYDYNTKWGGIEGTALIRYLPKISCDKSRKDYITFKIYNYLSGSS